MGPETKIETPLVSVGTRANVLLQRQNPAATVFFARNEITSQLRTPAGRILSGNGTNILSTIKSNLKTYQNCTITTHNPLRKLENTS